MTRDNQKQSGSGTTQLDATWRDDQPGFLGMIQLITPSFSTLFTLETIRAQSVEISKPETPRPLKFQIHDKQYTR